MFSTRLSKLFNPKILEVLGLILLLTVTLLLRVPNLGYSDYIGDEHKSFIRLDGGTSPISFFMDMRKGPMQYLVSYIPRLFLGDFRNELAQRIPFTVFGAASVFIFYLFLKKLTKSVPISLVASLLFCANGFVIGFARISQYQNLNLFFSFLALYFYTDFLEYSNNLLKNTLLGTLALSLSILSHWDAIFVALPIVYFFVVFLKNQNLSPGYKKEVILKNLLLGCVLLLPFLIPYTYHQIFDAANKEYFLRRVSVGIFALDNYKVLIRLYNPFLVLEFILVTATIGLFTRKSWLFFFWFLFNYVIFLFFVQKPGTHIYNFIIPALILSAFGVDLLVAKLPKYLKFLPVAIFACFFTFFVYQSYIIFVDNKIEYPWSRESLLTFVCKDKTPNEILLGKMTCKDFTAFFTTPVYKIEDNLPLFGFPMSRGWNKINDFINEQNQQKTESFGYTTNEAKTIAEKYMDSKYRVNNGFYIVAIRKPFSFVDDWNFSQYSKKQLVKTFYKDKTPVVKIYRVDIGME
ncbi:phospholipid carrier-dependent glycosyltransferase [candidate division WWE3 bacterium]|nr:phospholipid carrier-dependent glycosyltransferase [candidate division WWE3 bacterium]